METPLKTNANADEYLYGAKGPWPQPNQALPLWPIVAHIPKLEKRAYWWNIGLRYFVQFIYYWPVALWYAIRHRGLSPLSDQTFTDYMCNRSFSKFMYKASREDIKKFLPGFDMSRLKDDKEYFITDLFLMRHIPSQDKQFVAVTVSLFEKEEQVPNHLWEPMGMYVESVPKENQGPATKEVIYPEDGDAWKMAKYYAIMGCAYRIVFSVHSTLHFPMDALNAITKTMLPTHHTIFKLLLPHFKYSLELDLNVQTAYASPIKNHQEFPYCGVTGTADEIAGLFEDAHAGVRSRGKAYPPYHFLLRPFSESDSEYYRFQVEYYRTIHKFVSKVTDCLTHEEREELKPWADYIAPFINKHISTSAYEHFMSALDKHFPRGHEIFEKDSDDLILDNLLAKIIWDLTVGHAGDHYDYGMMDVAHVTMRMRRPAPASRKISNYDPRVLRNFWDTFRQRLEWRMFYIPTNVSLLYDTDYGFENVELQQLNKEFLADLKATEAGLASKNIRNFLPLKKISRSIQY